MFLDVVDGRPSATSDSSASAPPSAVGSEYAFEQAQPTAADFIDVSAF
jgi:hypothetical protein